MTSAHLQSLRVSEHLQLAGGAAALATAFLLAGASNATLPPLLVALSGVLVFLGFGAVSWPRLLGSLAWSLVAAATCAIAAVEARAPVQRGFAVVATATALATGILASALSASRLRELRTHARAADGAASSRS